MPSLLSVIEKEPACDCRFFFDLIDFHQIVMQFRTKFHSAAQLVARIINYSKNPHFIFFSAVYFKTTRIKFFHSYYRVRCQPSRIKQSFYLGSYFV